MLKIVAQIILLLGRDKHCLCAGRGLLFVIDSLNLGYGTCSLAYDSWLRAEALEIASVLGRKSWNVPGLKSAFELIWPRGTASARLHRFHIGVLFQGLWS